MTVEQTMRMVENSYTVDFTACIALERDIGSLGRGGSRDPNI